MWWILLKNPLTRYAAIGAAGLVVLAAAWHGGRWAQRADYRAAVAEARIENKETADEIEKAIGDLGDDALVDELFDRLLGADD